MSAVIASEAVIKVRVDTSGATIVAPSADPGAPAAPGSPSPGGGSEGGAAGRRPKPGAKGKANTEDLVDQVVQKFRETRSTVLDAPDGLRRRIGESARGAVRSGANAALEAVGAEESGSLAATGGYAAGIVMGAYAAVKAAPFVTATVKGLIPKGMQGQFAWLTDLMADLNTKAVRMESYVAAVAKAASRAERLAGASFMFQGEGRRAVDMTPQGLFEFAQEAQWIETRLGMKERFQQQRAVAASGAALGNFIARGARGFSQK